MSRRAVWIALVWGTVLGAFCGRVLAASPYDMPARNAATWLLLQHNQVDGSWGAREDVRYLQTSEAVLALAALNIRKPEYYSGLSWLENHAPANVDFRTRRVLALQSNGNSVASDIQYLQAAQNLSGLGNSGFGLSPVYQGAPLDTALALLAFQQAGITANVSNATDYLKAAQLTGSDKGWAIGQETESDPATTAQVLQVLTALRAGDASLVTSIANGVTTLTSKVSTASSVAHKALAALAYLRDNSSGSQAQAAILLNNLVATQGGDGSWNGETYETALAIRSLAAAMGTDLAAQKQIVAMSDANLRAAVNQALGRNAMDALNVGEIGRLITLDISNRGINNLNGLQYASNLTYLKADGNNITNLSPLAGLNLQGCSFVSNPVTGCTLGALTGPASLLKGSAGTYTASVNGYWPAQGMIVCKLDGIQQGAPFMPSGGVASCTVTPTTAGMHTISLDYAGPTTVSANFQVYDVATIMIIIDMLLDD